MSDDTLQCMTWAVVVVVCMYMVTNCSKTKCFSIKFPEERSE